MPNKFCEYLALGLSVMVAPTGMMADLAAKHNIGFQYNNASELAERLCYLADRKNEVAGMKVRARALYEAQFKADVVYGKMVEDIRRIIGK